MRICIASIGLDTFGGAERVILSDAYYLADAGHEVHILTREVDQEVVSTYTPQQNFKIHEYTNRESRILPDLLPRTHEIRKGLKHIKPDCVIAHYCEDATWLALSTLPIDPRFITHVHGSIFWFENKTNRAVHTWKECVQDLISQVPGHSEFWSIEEIPFTQLMEDSIVEVLEMITLRSCDDVFVNTNQVAQELDCLYNVSANVNPPGVDLENKEEVGNIDIDSPFIFSVSRLDPRKRIDLLVKSFAEIVDLNKNITLVIGGTGSEEQKIKNLVSKLGINEHVEFIGYVPEDDLYTYYSEAEIFACPGWMSYGLTPLEAVSSKTKVAVSSDAYVKEVIGNKDGVQVINPTVSSWVDGLQALIESDKVPSLDGIPTAKDHTHTKVKQSPE